MRPASRACTLRRSIAERYHLDVDIVYALEDPPASYTKAIFLAGPTPRTQSVPSWRPHALQHLQDAGYDGVVFVPEARSGVFHGDYDGQIAWEDRHLEMADCVLFWVPREMTTMPALTTNAEFGRWIDSGKAVFGAPTPDKPRRNVYLRHYAQAFDAPSTETLEDTVTAAMHLVGAGAIRSGGERHVPLHVWNTTHFQQWYSAQRAAGNRLDSAKLVWSFRVGPRRRTVFLWALHVDIYVAEEHRHKTNEVVLSRPDIAAVLLYRPAEAIDDVEVALVREFRAPAATCDGYIWELPGGSSFHGITDPLALALEECAEETGLQLDPAHVNDHGARQLAGTLSAHRAHLFSVKLEPAQTDALRRSHGVPHGVERDSERTYVEIVSIREIRRRRLLDWSTLGMILEVLLSEAGARS